MHRHSPHPRRIATILLMALGLVGLALSHGQSLGEPQGKGKGKGKGQGQGKVQGKDVAKDAPAPAADVTLPDEWVKQMRWRSVGPLDLRLFHFRSGIGGRTDPSR